MHPLQTFLFLEDKINSQYEKDKPDKVIQPEGFILEKQQGKSHKYNECYNLLYNFQLNQ